VGAGMVFGVQAPIVGGQTNLNKPPWAGSKDFAKRLMGWTAPSAALWQTEAVETRDGAHHGSDYSNRHGYVEAQFPTTWRQFG
jgi:hypothetical protein